MKVWNSMKLTLYYGICLTFVNGKIFSHKQRSLPLSRVSVGVPSESYDTLITNPRQSDFVSHSDLSDKTVLSDVVTTNIGNKLLVRRNVLNTNANQRNANNKKDENWLNGLRDNTIIKNGKQIELKGETSLISDQDSSPVNRLRRSDNSRFSVENLSSDDIFGLLTAAVHINDELSERVPYKVDKIHPGSLHSASSNDASFRRNRRGFRSAVADRIAHGFGKRTSAYGSDHDRLQELLRQSQLDQAGEILTIQPDDFDELESLLELYDNLQDKLQTSNNRYDVVSEDKESMGDIYRKVLKELQGFNDDGARPFRDDSYDSRKYRR
ncbi:uncharacterized protein LOC128550642 [Mercenaria mercenaria]|uniref:uncharacterized protein LOC128550642 n=1 Tax=Mercenaria mercenaria TaxID=6596 RepID=UPI00234EB3CE|nr:uncharacterized protein LOC128550642 [Mercenaria mercenaria]